MLLIPLRLDQDGGEVQGQLQGALTWYALDVHEHFGPKPKESAARLQRVVDAAVEMQKAIAALAAHERAALHRQLPFRVALALKLKGEIFRVIAGLDARGFADGIVSASKVAHSHFRSKGFEPVSEEEAARLKGSHDDVRLDPATGWRVRPRRGRYKGPDGDFVRHLAELWEQWTGELPTLVTDSMTGEKRGSFLKLCRLLSNHVRAKLALPKASLATQVQDILSELRPKDAN